MLHLPLKPTSRRQFLPRRNWNPFDIHPHLYWEPINSRCVQNIPKLLWQHDSAVYSLRNLFFPRFSFSPRSFTLNFSLENFPWHFHRLLHPMQTFEYMSEGSKLAWDSKWDPHYLPISKRYFCKMKFASEIMVIARNFNNQEQLLY